MSELTKRWIEGPTCSQTEWDTIDEMLAVRGWASLSRAVTRVLVAERDGKIVGFHVFQMVGYCGPLFIAREERGSGLAEDLVDDMQNFLHDSHARGYIAVTESPFAAKLCEKRGMERLPYPIYVMANPGGVEV